ncbi:FemAB family XrtA/PEP-CTERM system-associated protein [Agaribacter flavus]|uniref:FemAB family XrtA/PEP-CTERM system-associated protein n=1 Tax=Agaribacter flavus TaxID=1902781 RepID=A0ABV7FNV6_9ALTE
MTIKIITGKLINQERWDTYILTAPNASPYHLYGWGVAVENAYGFTCYRFAAIKEDEIVGVLAIINMRSLRGKKLLSALPYCDIGGIIADNKDVYSVLQTHLLNFAENLGIAELEIRNSESEVKDLKKVTSGEKVRMFLDLPSSEEALMEQFKSKLRSQIRKAEKNGLRYEVVMGSAIKTQELESFYEIIAKNMKALGSPVHSKQWYKEVISQYGSHAYMAIVYSENVVVGAGLVLTLGNKASIPWASTLNEYNRLAPNMLLYWAVLAQATKQGISTFDFGRSTVGEGTFNFKKQWGCLPIKLQWQSFRNGEALIELPSKSSPSRDKLASAWRCLPLPVANFLGPILRRYISL